MILSCIQFLFAMRLCLLNSKSLSDVYLTRISMSDNLRWLYYFFLKELTLSFLCILPTQPQNPRSIQIILHSTVTD